MYLFDCCSVGSSEDDQIDTEDEEETHTVQEEHEGIDFTKPWDHSDITFIVDDQKVYANKMILSMNSPVMKTMFESDFKEKNLEEIELPGKKLNTFVNLMKALHPPNKFIGMCCFSVEYWIRGDVKIPTYKPHTNHKRSSEMSR